MVIEVDSQALYDGRTVLANRPLDFFAQLIDQLTATLDSKHLTAFRFDDGSSRHLDIAFVNSLILKIMASL